MNTSLNVGPSDQGARGYKFTGVDHRDLGRWGDHRFNAFYSNHESWNWQFSKRFYEVDAGGNVIQNPAAITNTESGRNVMPAVWMTAFPESLIGGIPWPATGLVHPNGKRYRLLPQVYPGAVPATANNPLGISGAINPATGQISAGYIKDDTNEESYGFSVFSSWWKGRIDMMAGFRFETADTVRLTTGVAKGPSVTTAPPSVSSWTRPSRAYAVTPTMRRMQKSPSVPTPTFSIASFRSAKA